MMWKQSSAARGSQLSQPQQPEIFQTTEVELEQTLIPFIKVGDFLNSTESNSQVIRIKYGYPRPKGAIKCLISRVLYLQTISFIFEAGKSK